MSSQSNFTNSLIYTLAFLANRIAPAQPNPNEATKFQ